MARSWNTQSVIRLLADMHPLCEGESECNICLAPQPLTFTTTSLGSNFSLLISTVQLAFTIHFPRPSSLDITSGNHSYIQLS